MNEGRRVADFAADAADGGLAAGNVLAIVDFRKKEKGRRKKEEGRRKKEEGRRKKEEGRRKREEGRGKKEEGKGKKEVKIVRCAVRTLQG
ncbi:MAG: hypothetical protein ACRC62_24550 [Microcoleus sp.]